MTARLTALDATFLELEQADPAAHMHIGAVMVFAPPAGGGPPSLEEVRHRLALRLDALPRFRQRLSQPDRGGDRLPALGGRPGLRPRRITSGARRCPRPAATAELLEWAGDFYSHRLDRDASAVGDGRSSRGSRTAAGRSCTKTHQRSSTASARSTPPAVLLDVAADAPTSGWHPPPPGRDHPTRARRRGQRRART